MEVGACDGGEEQAWLKVMEVATICSVPMALKAAIELNVMDILLGAHQFEEGGHLSAAQIVSQLDSSSHLTRTNSSVAAAATLDRILTLLASHGFLASSSHNNARAYGLNSVTRYLLQSKAQGSLAPFVLLVQDPIVIQCLYDLQDTVLHGGEPFRKVHGVGSFSYTQQDARFDGVFNRAMFGHTTQLVEDLLEAYNGFEDVNTLVDVGGGVGACLSLITSKHPHIKGINFDLPHVIKAAPRYKGVEQIGGDMFTKIPEGDAIFMKWILHDWNDELCIKILQNCYKALPTKGKIIVVDAILPRNVDCGLDARVRYQMDLLMLAFTEGGKERTREELEYISKAAGFSKLQVMVNIHACNIVEIFK